MAMGGLASALQPDQGGLLQRLLGAQGQSGLGQRLTDLLNPQVALPMAGALIAGRTPQAGVGDALTLGGLGLGKLKETRAVDAKKNSAKAYLMAKHPELAQMVEMGMPVEDAFSEALKLDHPSKKGLMNAGDGQLYDQDTGQWITAPGGIKTKAPNVQEFYDENGPYKAQWNADTGTWDRVGGTKPPAVKAPTEQVVRNRQLYKVMAPEVKNLLGDGVTPGKFDALASTANQAGDFLGNIGKSVGAGDLSGFTTSGEYQSAKNSLKTIVASYLYSVSGATANPGEVETQTNVLMPKPGEDPMSVAAKKARIKVMVEAVESVAAGTGTDIMSPLPKGTTSGGVEWNVEQ